jgi:hypothetical protein
MRTRSDWSGMEWAICYICLIASSALLILLFAGPTRSLPIAFLIVGASFILGAASWIPGLLIKPPVPASLGDMQPVEIPRVAAFVLILAAYILIAGAIVGWWFRNQL